MVDLEEFGFDMKKGAFVALTLEGQKELAEAAESMGELSVPIDVLAHGMWVIEDYDPKEKRVFVSAFRLTEFDQVLGEGGFWLDAENVIPIRQAGEIPARVKTAGYYYRRSKVCVRRHRRRHT